jgi:hypothetical protein
MKQHLRQFCEQPGKKFATALLNDWIWESKTPGYMLLQMARMFVSLRSCLLAWFTAEPQTLLAGVPMDDRALAALGGH